MINIGDSNDILDGSTSAITTAGNLTLRSTSQGDGKTLTLRGAIQNSGSINLTGAAYSGQSLTVDTTNVFLSGGGSDRPELQ